MQQLRTILFSLIVMPLLLSGCLGVTRGSGTIIEETRPLNAINALDVSGSGEVLVELGAESAVTIRTDDNLLEQITTNVRGTTLEIGVRGAISPTDGIAYVVTMPEVVQINTSGSVDVVLPPLTGDLFEYESSGSGDLSAESMIFDAMSYSISGSSDLDLLLVETQLFDLQISGSAVAIVRGGTAREQVIDISGSGGYDGRALQSNVATVDVNGSGNATVRVSEELEADVSGSATVRYLGNPPTVDSNVDGSGEVLAVADETD